MASTRMWISRAALLGLAGALLLGGCAQTARRDDANAAQPVSAEDREAAKAREEWRRRASSSGGG